MTKWWNRVLEMMHMNFQDGKWLMNYGTGGTNRLVDMDDGYTQNGE